MGVGVSLFIGALRTWRERHFINVGMPLGAWMLLVIIRTKECCMSIVCVWMCNNR